MTFQNSKWPAKDSDKRNSLWRKSMCSLSVDSGNILESCGRPFLLALTTTHIIPVLGYSSQLLLDNIPSLLWVMWTGWNLLTPVNRARNEHKTSHTKTNAYSTLECLPEYYCFVCPLQHSLLLAWHLRVGALPSCCLSLTPVSTILFYMTWVSYLPSLSLSSLIWKLKIHSHIQSLFVQHLLCFQTLHRCLR